MESTKIKVGSRWTFNGLDEPSVFEVVKVGRGQYGSVLYRTAGTEEPPTARKRKEFLANFKPE